MNEIFDADRVDSFYNSSAEKRRQAVLTDRATNYGVVRLDLIDRIYEDMYMQRFENPNEEEWAHRMFKGRVVKKIDVGDSNGPLKLHVSHVDADGAVSGIANHAVDVFEVDALMVATGYRRDAHKHLLRQAEYLRPQNSDDWVVQRDYSVEFDSNKVSKDAGIYLQGCNEKTHGLSDSLLSILATRGGEMVDAIFGNEIRKIKG